MPGNRPRFICICRARQQSALSASALSKDKSSYQLVPLRKLILLDRSAVMRKKKVASNGDTDSAKLW
jgi:hypothetical protein